MLAFIEDDLADAWQACLAGDERAFHVMSMLWRTVSSQAEMVDAEIVLVDTGPAVGALNRAAMLAADHIVFPIAPGIAGRQALAGVGSRLRDWRTGWQARLGRNPDPERIPLPVGNIRPTGYVVLQGGSRAVSENDVSADYRANLTEAEGKVISPALGC